MSPHGKRAGFTLIEVLLTLLIVAGIMVTITQILSAARQSRDAIHNIQEQELAGPAILNQIESDLRALFAYARDPRLALRVENRVLSGFDADALDLVTTVDGVLPWRERSGQPFRRADANEVGYRLRPNADSDDFLELYRREDFGIDEEPFEGGKFALLHDRVKGFDIRVFREDGVEAEPLEAWGGASDEFVGVPHRLEIELTLELAPRLVREQLLVARNTVTYRRVFRFPQMLLLAQEIGPVPVIPRISKPVANTPGAGGAAAGGETATGRGGDEVQENGSGGTFGDVQGGAGDEGDR
jgi:prepilin-type N-terminal cleavage/methylation domain-containing protein